MFLAGYIGVHHMHSLETGIVISIAMFFFLSFLTFTFLREGNISKEINDKLVLEKSAYEMNGEKVYNPERSFNIMNIILEGYENGNGEE